MRIEKTDCNYQVTECDLKFGEQITLDGELLIPISVIDKIRADIQFIKDKCLPNTIAEEYEQKGLQEALDIIDKYKAI